MATPATKIVLVGAVNTGKSHLAYLWAERVNAKSVSPAQLRSLDIPGVEQPLVLDDAEELGEDDEEPLFHLHNHLATSGLAFLLTARHPPAQWNLRLPDLKSRMDATDSVRINDMQDESEQVVYRRLAHE